MTIELDGLCVDKPPVIYIPKPQPRPQPPTPEVAKKHIKQSGKK